jgi:ubiquinone biosynthesis protein
MKITAIPHLYRNVNRWREILTILSKYGLAVWISRLDLSLVKGMKSSARPSSNLDKSSAHGPTRSACR